MAAVKFVCRKRARGVGGGEGEVWIRCSWLMARGECSFLQDYLRILRDSHVVEFFECSVIVGHGQRGWGDQTRSRPCGNANQICKAWIRGE